MQDIIVCFDEKKMGYGDILFAAKLAHELKTDLMKQGKLVGNVYLVCTNDNRGLSKVEGSKADCEFGINFILLNNLNRLIAEGKVKPAIIIDAPAPMLIKIKYPEAFVVVSLEYSYGPFMAANLGDSYAHATESKQLAYQRELEKFESSMLKQYSNGEKKIIRTGLLETIHERGVLPAKALAILGSLIHVAKTQSQAQSTIDSTKQGYASKLSAKTVKSIFGANVGIKWSE